MKTVAVVAWREIIEHRMFLLAALAALAVTLVVPLVPGFLGWSSSDVREVLLWLMALGFSWLSALFLGASMVTGAVAEGRFGFFLARPVSAAAIWFGKLLGVLAVVLTCQLLVVVPAALLAGWSELIDSRIMAWGALEVLAVGAIIAVPALLVLMAHGVATVWRGGTAWAGVDLIALTVVIAAGWLSIGSLIQVGADDAATVVGLLWFGGLTVAVIAAGALQVARGRCDVRRQHWVFSSVMWTVLLSASAGCVGYAVWLLHPAAADLTRADDIHLHPGGSWLALAGPTRGRIDVEGTFAVNLGGSSSLLLGLGTAWDWRPAPAFSADGRVAAWPVRDGAEWRIRYADLEAPTAGVLDSPIIMTSRPWPVLSAHGRRLATVEDDTLVVTEVSSGKLVGSVRLPTPRKAATRYFVGEDRVRLLLLTPEGGQGGRQTLLSLEFDCQSRTLATTGTLQGPWDSFTATFDGARDRLLLRLQEVHRSVSYRYVDARSLEPVGWSAEQELGRFTEMMADGRLVRLVDEAEGCRLERLATDGGIDGSARLQWCPERTVIGFQPSSSTVTVAAARSDWDHEGPEGSWVYGDWALFLADLDSGRLSEIGAQSVPLRWWYRYGQVRTPLPAGCAAARLFLGEGRSLWWWQPEGRDMEPVVRGRR